MVNRKGLGQANTFRTNNNTSTGYGIAYADEVSGHRTVGSLADLYVLHDWQLSASGDNTDNDAIGQLWYVVNADGNGNGCYYQLKDWSKRNEAAGWSEFKGTGASTAAAVTFDNTASGMTAVTAQGAIEELNVKKFAKANIVQELGNSEEHVMSQKGVTELVKKTSTFAGIATPTTDPGTPKAKVFYIANGKGTYDNFGGIDVTEDDVVILYYDTAWHKVATGIASQEKLTELESKIGGEQTFNITKTTKRYDNSLCEFFFIQGVQYSMKFTLASSVEAPVYIGFKRTDGTLVLSKNIAAGNTLLEFTYTPTENINTIVNVGCAKENTLSFVASWTIKGIVTDLNKLANDLDELNVDVKDTSTIVNNIISYNVSQFYSNAWVRYSDGLINGSSGGSKLYIVNRDSIGNADKLYIHTCTQNENFAAVAFYSSKIPSQKTYLKDISIQGIKSSVGYDIEIDLTDGWQSALILNMSQLDANYSCVIKDSNLARKEELISTLEKVEELETTIKDPTNKFFYEISPFVEKPFIHHLNQENNSAIPAQSLLDISYAKRLGCNMIEINPHKCSDGVIVCKHGSGGALGVGLISADGNDYSNTQFSSVTSNWLRENISYAKVEGLRIPTLDEFCSVCKQESMMVRVGQNIDVNALNTIRKYLSDNMIYIDSFTSRANGTFRGIIGRIWNPSSKSIDNFLEDIKDVGKPLDVVIASGTFDSLSDEALSHAVQECHKKGYTITMTYPNAESSIRALKFGIDTILSNNNLTNQIHFGNEKNVFVGDNDITLDGATMVNGKIQMLKASSIIIPCSKTIKNGVVSLRIRYAGTISSSCGTSLGLNNHVSNGESFINLTLAIEDGTNWLHIVANENSVIFDMQARCSRI